MSCCLAENINAGVYKNLRGCSQLHKICKEFLRKSKYLPIK